MCNAMIRKIANTKIAKEKGIDVNGHAAESTRRSFAQAAVANAAHNTASFAALKDAKTGGNK